VGSCYREIEQQAIITGACGHLKTQWHRTRPEANGTEMAGVPSAVQVEFILGRRWNQPHGAGPARLDQSRTDNSRALYPFSFFTSPMTPAPANNGSRETEAVRDQLRDLGA
jgi:hypothetical protein